METDHIKESELPLNEQDKLQKHIFDEEQAHLTTTHGKLRAMKAALEEINDNGFDIGSPRRICKD